MSSSQKKRTLVLKKKTSRQWAAEDRRRLREGMFGKLFGGLLPGVAGRMRLKMSLASLWESFPPHRVLSRFLDRFLKTRVRATAVGILCFGFLCAAFSLLRLFSREIQADSAVMELSLSLAIVLGSLVMTLSRSLWCEALEQSLFVSLWTNVLSSYRPDELERRGEYHRGGRFSLFAGVALGLLSWVISPLWIVLGVVTLILLWQIFYKPEFGLSLIALLFGFFSESLLLSLALVVLLSFLFKLLRGKRVVRFETADVVAIFMLLLWAGGVPFGHARLSVVCLGGVIYFLFAKMIKSIEQAQRIFSFFVFQLFVFGVLFFFGRVLDWSASSWLQSIYREASLQEFSFEVPLNLVMMLLPVAAVAVLKNGAMKLVSFAGLAMGLCMLLFSQSPGAIFCFALSLIALALLLGKRMIPVFIGLAAVFMAVSLASPSTVAQLFSDVPALVVNAWNEQLEILGAVFGRDLISVLFGSWTGEGSGLNFWGTFLYRFGLSGCSVFVAMLLFFLRTAASAFEDSKGNASSRLVGGTLLSVGVLLVRGITADFADQALVFGAFWLMCGLLCAIGAIAENDASHKDAQGGMIR